jgi:molybdopterin converting factor small subunit
LKVRVELYASLREKAGVKEVELDLPLGSTVASLLEELRLKLGLPAEDVEACRVLIDGRDSEAMGGRRAQLRDGCIASLFPPIAGG